MRLIAERGALAEEVRALTTELNERDKEIKNLRTKIQGLGIEAEKLAKKQQQLLEQRVDQFVAERTPYVLGRPKIQDYARFKAAFDEYGATRKANGSKGARIFRNADEPTDITILIEFEDLEKAREFFQSQGLREQMQRAGVAARPEILFLEEVDRTAE